MPLYISPPPRNPLTAALAAVLGAVLVAAAFFLGFIVLLVFLVAGLLIWLGVLIRFKWLERSLRKRKLDPLSSTNTNHPGPGNHGSAIEGEFTVVSRDRDD